jgi:hypothetical protein
MIIPASTQCVSSALFYDTSMLMASLDDNHVLAQLESYETAIIYTAYNWPKSHYVVHEYIWDNIAALHWIIESLSKYVSWKWKKKNWGKHNHEGMQTHIVYAIQHTLNHSVIRNC